MFYILHVFYKKIQWVLLCRASWFRPEICLYFTCIFLEKIQWVGSLFVVCFQNQPRDWLRIDQKVPYLPPPCTSVAEWFVLHSVSVQSFYPLRNVAMTIIFTDDLDWPWLRTLVEKNLIQSMKVMGSERPDIQKSFMNVLKIYVFL